MTTNKSGKWYSRVKGKTAGPFPTGLLRRYVLIGRLSKDDEVSVDKSEWLKVADVPDLIPDLLNSDPDDEFAHERLKAARRWADERLQLDRRSDSDDPSHRRRGSDRRSDELEDVLRHRGSLRARQLGDEYKSTITGWLFLIAAVLAIGYGGYYAYQHQPEEVLVDCNAAPGPNVNWANCPMQGRQLQQVTMSDSIMRNTNFSSAQLQQAVMIDSDLAYANLSLATLIKTDLSRSSLLGANLRGANLSGAILKEADLSFANLTSATITGADLTGTSLHKAIWIDGTQCAAGSVGSCLPIKEK